MEIYKIELRYKSGNLYNKYFYESRREFNKQWDKKNNRLFRSSYNIIGYIFNVDRWDEIRYVGGNNGQRQ